MYVFTYRYFIPIFLFLLKSKHANGGSISKSEHPKALELSKLQRIKLMFPVQSSGKLAKFRFEPIHQEANHVEDSWNSNREKKNCSIYFL